MKKDLKVGDWVIIEGYDSGDEHDYNGMVGQITHANRRGWGDEGGDYSISWLTKDGARGWGHGNWIRKATRAEQLAAKLNGGFASL